MKNLHTLKNQAPDFFQVSLCSPQILQYQARSFPSSTPATPPPRRPPMVLVSIEVTEELEDNDELGSEFLLSLC